MALEDDPAGREELLLAHRAPWRRACALARLDPVPATQELFEEKGPQIVEAEVNPLGDRLGCVPSEDLGCVR